MWRNAKKAPRRISPISASVKSGYKAAKTDWKRKGNPVQQRTIPSTNQTLLTSQTRHRMVDELARPAALRTPAGKEVPYACAEIDTAGGAVRSDDQQQEESARVRE